MSKNDDEIDGDEIDYEDEDNENDELSFMDKKSLSADKMDFKRKLEEYLENKRLEDELSYY